MTRSAALRYLALVALPLVPLALSIGGCADTPVAPVARDMPDPRREAGREIAQQFGAELKGALERAMTSRGPAAAILVCREEAPRIAARLSAERGARVARTALRVRNPANDAQPWKRTVLASFATQLQAGAKPETLERFETLPDGGARYLKAIVTAPLCVACHGKTLAPDIQHALAQHYPRDQATGFDIGDLRGAFSVEWAP